MKLELKQGEAPRIDGQPLRDCVSIVVEATPTGVHASIFVRNPDLDLDIDTFTITARPSWWQRLKERLRCTTT